MTPFTNKMLKFLSEHHIAGEVGYIIIAAIGGAAKYMENYIRIGEFRMLKFLANIFVSCFSGLIFVHFARSIGINGDAAAMVAGLGGFMGAKAVEFVYGRITDTAQVTLPVKAIPEVVPVIAESTHE